MGVGEGEEVEEAEEAEEAVWVVASETEEAR